MKKTILVIIIILLAGYGIYSFLTHSNNPVDTLFEKSEKNLVEPVADVSNAVTNDTEKKADENIKESERVLVRYACTGDFCEGSRSENAASTTIINIPLVINDGGPVGCGASIVYAPHAVPKTVGVLDATYKLLFELKPEAKLEGEPRNTLGNYPKLHYKSVSLKDGTAKLYLDGAIFGPGVCATPEMRAQINQAALQFDTVDTLEVYLNGNIFDRCRFSESGNECTYNPWIVNID